MLLPDTERALLHRLATAQHDSRVPSIAAAVVRGGARAWAQAIETTTDTQFRIGSLTKTFVAVLVMRLRDEERLGLDDPLERHLPEAQVRGVSIGQLLAHTAGLASETPAPWWERTPGDLRPQLADLVDPSPKHPPGRRFHYSNPGFALLGAVVERLRGTPLPEVLQREILDPLEMTRTSLQPQEPHARGLAVHPWADAVMPEVVQDVGRMAPAGQLWSTVQDLGRWAAFLAGDTADLLDRDTLEEMLEPHVVADLPGLPWTGAHGLGWQVWNVDGRRYAGHGGSMPGFLAGLRVDLESGDGAVVFANTTAGMRPALATELLTAYAELEPKPVAPWHAA
ncbi:MAG TPA: serine hydrolase domain-containing protein, partial [Candidatus Limnocylindria bacterium]